MNSVLLVQSRARQLRLPFHTLPLPAYQSIAQIHVSRPVLAAKSSKSIPAKQLAKKAALVKSTSQVDRAKKAFTTSTSSVSSSQNAKSIATKDQSAQKAVVTKSSPQNNLPKLPFTPVPTSTKVPAPQAVKSVATKQHPAQQAMVTNSKSTQPNGLTTSATPGIKPPAVVAEDTATQADNVVHDFMWFRRALVDANKWKLGFPIRWFLKTRAAILYYKWYKDGFTWEIQQQDSLKGLKHNDPLHIRCTSIARKLNKRGFTQNLKYSLKVIEGWENAGGAFSESTSHYVNGHCSYLLGTFLGRN